MDTEYTKKYLCLLLDFSFLLSRQIHIGVNHCEFLHIHIWKTLSEKPELKLWFLEMVSETVNKIDLKISGEDKRPDWFIDDDLIYFIVHLSRWPEFERIANQRRLKIQSDGRILGSRDVSDSILEALKDDWEDRDFYDFLK